MDLIKTCGLKKDLGPVQCHGPYHILNIGV